MNVMYFVWKCIFCQYPGVWYLWEWIIWIVSDICFRWNRPNTPSMILHWWEICGSAEGIPIHMKYDKTPWSSDTGTWYEALWYTPIHCLISVSVYQVLLDLLQLAVGCRCEKWGITYIYPSFDISRDEESSLLECVCSCWQVSKPRIR